MKETIEQISSRIYQKLPENEHQPMKDVQRLPLPDFLYKTIRFRVNANIGDQLILPSSEWVKTEAEQIQQTKQLLLEALYDEAQLPANEARTVIQKSVTDIVKVLVQPRKNIPEVLFGRREVLSKEAVEKEVQKLSVYLHFGRVLIGYMKRKNRSKLTKQQCANIITNVDEKLTEGYSPKQWAQLLEPLFVLTEGSPRSDLFYLFFSDKRMTNLAEIFKQVGGAMNRQKFVETISTAQSGEADKAVQHEGKAKIEKKSSFSPPSPVVNEDKKLQTVTDKNEKKTSDNSSVDFDKKKENQSADKKTKNTPSVNTAFTGKEKAPEPQSLNDFFAAKQVEKQEEKNGDRSNQPEGDKRSEPVAEESKKQPEDTAVPIWQRFAKNKEDSENQTADRAEQNKSKTETERNRKKELKRHLGIKEKLFIDELFNGSRAEYEKSMAAIAAQTEWQQAVKTIQNDIFEKNDVDIYSPAAIEFTDLLQSYFKQRNF